MEELEGSNSSVRIQNETIILDYSMCWCAQSLLTLCDSMDWSPPGSSDRGILQARILGWAAFSSPGDLPDPGTEPKAPALQADSLSLCHLGSHREIKSPSIWLSTNSSHSTVHRWREGQLAKSEQSRQLQCLQGIQFYLLHQGWPKALLG